MRGATGIRRGISVLLVAGAVAGGVLVAGTTTDSGAGDLANLWVELGAGSCSRSSTTVTYAGSASPDARCGTLDQGYDAANTSSATSQVYVKGGTYGYDGDDTNQQITGSRSSTNRITIEAAPGETPVFEGVIELGVGIGDAPSHAGQAPDYLTLKGLTTSTFQDAVGTAYLNDTNRFGIKSRAGVSNVTLEDMTAGSFAMWGNTDMQIIGGSYGPCRADPLDAFGGTANPCDLNYMLWSLETPERQTERVMIDGSVFHDYDYPPECVTQAAEGPDGCHWRMMYMNAVSDVTIRNSTFRDSVFSPWTTICCDESFAAGGPNTDGNSVILIENNEFGAPLSTNPGTSGGPYSSGAGGWENAWCQIAAQPSYRDVTFRFNSFARGAFANFPGWYDGENTCQVQNFEVYGNIFGVKPACSTFLAGGTSINWHHNVYAGGTAGTCNATDVNVGGGTMPWYADDDQGPDAGDFALTAAAFAGDDLVPVAEGCPATDFDGTARPSAGFCDAGAHER